MSNLKVILWILSEGVKLRFQITRVSFFKPTNRMYVNYKSKISLKINSTQPFFFNFLFTIIYQFQLDINELNFA